MLKNIFFINIIFLFFFFSFGAYSQEAADIYENSEISDLVENNKFSDAIVIINKEIEEYYSKNVENKRLPTDFITVESAEEAIDLNKMYRERKNKLFQIEINSKMYFMHLNAAVSYHGMGEFDKAINHYYQALRFTHIEKNKTDEVFFGLSQTYKALKNLKAYRDSLETAYEINPEKAEYSLELGKDLYKSKQVKKSIYHLERYLKLIGEEPDSEIFIMLAGLHEQAGKYLNSLKYYQLYLEKNPENGDIYYALGYAAYYHTGNYDLALKSFAAALKYLDDNEILKKSKCYEYSADIYRKDLKYENAIASYGETKQYELKVKKDLDSLNKELDYIDSQIKELKSGLIKEKNFVQYTQYQFQLSEKDRVQKEIDEKMYEYRKLNSGKVRWNTAICYEKLEEFEKAIEYYRESITFNYKANRSRQRIIKLQLKIKRGY